IPDGYVGLRTCNRSSLRSHAPFTEHRIPPVRSVRPDTGIDAAHRVARALTGRRSPAPRKPRARSGNPGPLAHRPAIKVASRRRESAHWRPRPPMITVNVGPTEGGAPMTILQLLTPIADASWLSATDTVRDALDHLETYELSAAPLVDRTGRYAGTVTQADLRRHVAGAADRAAALATPLSAIERRARNPAVGIEI